MSTRTLRVILTATLAVSGLTFALPSASADSGGGTYRNSPADQATTRRLAAEAKAVKLAADPKSARGVTPSVWGSYPTRAGTFMSTNSKASGVGPVGHSAMVYNYWNVVESNPSTGVAYGANDWYNKSSNVWGMTTRATTVGQDSYAAYWASWQRGKGYNWNYYNMGTRSSFYCSQLVWAAFRDTPRASI